MRQRMIDLVHREQDRICAALRELDGGDPREDAWTREGGGGGRTRVFSEGKVFEKAGVNVSVVHGTLRPEAARAMGGGQALSDDEDLDFFATGLSLVLHPWNPMAPTVHANYRYFERGDGERPGSWWFGGGADLTPSYLFAEDAEHFHGVHKAVCDAHDVADYDRFKAWCDDYFHVRHRGERRGVGGLFFDDMNDAPKEECFAFVEACAEAFLPSYLPILERRMNMPYNDAQREWQQVRRGRYVEFNLVYDRGTTFGLNTNGRVESILMSLPLTARWEYAHTPAEGTPEAELLEVLQTPRDWV
ncbi:MAG: oxygen-dependent coproporphyrinogen oxidase [Euryarchaeota archaeon]|nr:oxygen-dependent coproporphyrinogen oxidase [Euryarchaeota archaeon]OUX23125.1 MAG: coproporphyrinogen III oxidase [Euryarchaeota archaeon TMED252]DAC35304.1 MAG TPA: oxygen-dependent coproporphyrinogen oxidase [Candidatus Poseidoniales archaeon]HIH53709.1 oxygen-dependent coproporphyrinogen oxidase [Candidatus Poseidoniaceae archaeon]